MRPRIFLLWLGAGDFWWTLLKWTGLKTPDASSLAAGHVFDLFIVEPSGAGSPVSSPGGFNNSFTAGSTPRRPRAAAAVRPTFYCQICLCHDPVSTFSSLILNLEF
jgi:hypothetical protein